MKKAFLITPFSPERAGNEDPATYRAVQDAVTEASALAEVELIHPSRMNAAGEIMEQVQQAISEVDVVLAILTGQNPNVFYEIGIALEKAQRPAILITPLIEEIPFDVRHHRCIIYNDTNEQGHLVLSIKNAILETLELKSKSDKYPQPDLYLRLVNKTQENRFFYGARSVPFVGMDREVNELDQFLQTDQTFLWWSIIGAGGSGKSRLALEYCLMKETSWHAGFLRDMPFDWANWRPNLPTLIFADYAAGRAEELNAICLTLFERRNRLPFPVRLVLMERENYSNQDKEPPWYSAYLGFGGERHAILAMQYKEAALEPNELAEDDLWKIIESVFEQLDVTAPNKSKTLKRLREIDSRGRPLFAALLADALASKGDERNWDRTTLVRDILRRDEAKYWNSIGVTPEDKHLVALATMTGGLPVARLPFFNNVDLLPNRRDFSPERYQVVSGELATESLTPLEPDLLGELFVLDLLMPAHAADDWRVETLVRLAWNEAPRGMSQFIGKVVLDYPDHPTVLGFTMPPFEQIQKCPEQSELVRYWGSAAFSLITGLRAISASQEVIGVYETLTSLRDVCPSDTILAQLESAVSHEIAVRLVKDSNFDAAWVLFDRVRELVATNTFIDSEDRSHPTPETDSVMAGKILDEASNRQIDYALTPIFPGTNIFLEHLFSVAIFLGGAYYDAFRGEDLSRLYSEVAKMADEHREVDILQMMKADVASSYLRYCGTTGNTGLAVELLGQLDELSGKFPQLPLSFYTDKGVVSLVFAYCMSGNISEARDLRVRLVASVENIDSSEAETAISLVDLLVELSESTHIGETCSHLSGLAKTNNRSQEFLFCVAASLCYFCTMFGNAQRLADAQTIYELLVDLSGSAPYGSAFHGYRITALFNLSNAYANAGYPDEGLALHEDLTSIVEETENQVAKGMLAKNNVNFIEITLRNGDNDKALELYERTVALALRYPEDANLREHQVRGAGSLINLLPPGAEFENLYKEIAAIVEQHPGEDNLLEWQSKAALALMQKYDTKGRDKARALYDDIVALRQQSSTAPSLIMAQAWGIFLLLHLYNENLEEINELLLEVEQDAAVLQVLQTLLSGNQRE